MWSCPEDSTQLLPQVMLPALGLVSSTLFVFPLLALVTPHSCTQNGACTQGSHMGAHKLAHHPGRGAESPPENV